MGVFSTKGRDWSKPFSGRSASYSLESFAPGLNGGVHKSQASLFGTSWLSLRPTLGGKEEIESPFHENWVVYACIRLLSQALGGVPLRVWRSRDPEAEEVPETHPLVKLLRRPNRDTSWAQFAAAGITHRKLTGEDFWFLFGRDGKPLVPYGETGPGGRPLLPDAPIDYPSALYSVAGSAVDDERDTLGRPVYWTYAARSGSVVPKFAPASIVHFRDYDPSDPVRGIGDAEVAIRQISIQHQVERSQESTARSGGPGAFISLKRDIGIDERDRFQDEINAEIRSAEGGYKVLSGDATIIPNPATPDKMQNIELLRWSRDVICTVMGVPVQCIGASESQTYSNMKEAWAQFYNGLASYCRSIEDVVNSSFLPRLTDKEAQGFYVAFDFSEVEALQEDDSDRWLKAADMAARGVGLSFNAAAATLQLDHEPTPAGDVIFVSSGTQILNDDGTLPEPEPAPDMEPGEDAEEDEDAPTPKDEKGLELRLRHPALKTVEERAAYHKRFSVQILETGDRKLYRAVRHWFTAYEREQIARLREFAAKGVDGKRFKAALVERSRVTKDISDDVEVFLQVSREKWARLLGTATRDLLEDVYADALHDMARELGVVSLPMADIRVIEFLAEQQLQLTEGVSSTVAERVKSALVEALGEPATISDLQLAVREKLPDLTEELRRIFGSKDARALTIARTETGHAASGARFEQMKAVGIAKHQWISSRDAHVRESHEQLDGEIREIGADFKPGLERPHDPDAPASEVVNCFVPDTAVSGAFVAGSKARYSGTVWEIETARGRRLTVTPNHPVMTAQGWRAAHEVCKGDRLLTDRGHDRVAVLGDVDHQHGEATIADVFQALAADGAVLPRVVSALDFHGDAERFAADIDVEGSYGELWGEVSNAGQGGQHLGLIASDPEPATGHRGGTGGPNRNIVLVATAGTPSRAALSLDAGPIMLERGPLEALRIGPAADWHASVSQQAKERRAADPVFIRELLQASAGAITLDEVVEVRQREFDGHVYDLQSTDGWILAQGVVCGNCRCVSLPVLED